MQMHLTIIIHFANHERKGLGERSSLFRNTQWPAQAVMPYFKQCLSTMHGYKWLVYLKIRRWILSTIHSHVWHIYTIVFIEYVGHSFMYRHLTLHMLLHTIDQLYLIHTISKWFLCNIQYYLVLEVQQCFTIYYDFKV